MFKVVDLKIRNTFVISKKKKKNPGDIRNKNVCWKCHFSTLSICKIVNPDKRPWRCD